MKGFAKYFTLTILLLLGLCCVGVLYLFFVPNSTLFGIKYISLNTTTSKSFNTKNVDSLVISSINYDVEITTTEEDSLLVDVYSNSFGFVLDKNSYAEINYTLVNNVLSIDIKEPHGFAISNNSKVKIAIPENNEFNLHLKNKKANTSINSEKLTINKFKYETTSGDCNLKNAKINNDLILDLNNSDFNVSSEIKTSNNNVKLNITTGKFNAASSTFNNITINNNKRGVIIFKQCNQLIEDVPSAGGRIEADIVSNINVKTSGTNIYVKDITNGATIELDSGNVSIEAITGNSSSIVTNSGDINIQTINSNIILKTNNGNINVTNSKSTINVKTEYGNINVNFNEESPNLNYLIADVKDGFIGAVGVEKISLTITGNGRAVIDMKDIVGVSSINGNSGNVYVKVNKYSIYKLITESKGSVRVNLTQIPQYGGYRTKEETITYVNCNTNFNTQNILEVKTGSGDLTILDTNFAKN